MNSYDLLNRVTYGPTPAARQQLEQMGWEKWVEWQLKGGEDEEWEQRVKAFRYEMEFGREGREKVREVPLETYFLDTPGLLGTLKGQEEPPDSLLRRPAFETFLVTWLRQLHSQWQLREIIVEFWHNHFNVSIDAHDAIPLLFPVYDRDVIRRHAFGNFRAFLEATAKSPCMLYYLDNAFSKSGPANENYARELFELHTLGAENYFNHLYDEWRQVPGAWEGKAEGYIDEDVYEAARAFTGWTVGDGEEHADGVVFPETGEFHYYDQWHDHYQKRVLGVEFKSHQGPMADGHKVLDLLAYHPGTAHFVCTKLVRWLVADEPPETLVQAAVDTWMAHQQAPDQIERVVRTVLLAPEFQQYLGQKVKRPNVLISSIVRTTETTASPNEGLFWLLRQMGYQQFSWAPPTGHPDNSAYWLNTEMMLKRWNTVPIVMVADLEEDEGVIETAFADRTPDVMDSGGKLIDFWSEKVLGKKPPEAIREDLERVWMEDMEGASVAYVREHHPDGFEFKLRQMISLLAMSPDFQRR